MSRSSDFTAPLSDRLGDDVGGDGCKKHVQVHIPRLETEAAKAQSMREFTLNGTMASLTQIYSCSRDTKYLQRQAMGACEVV